MNHHAPEGAGTVVWVGAVLKPWPGRCRARIDDLGKVSFELGPSRGAATGPHWLPYRGTPKEYIEWCAMHLLVEEELWT